MNKRILIVTLTGFLLLNIAQLYIEKIIIHKKTINNFTNKNIFINYSFKKVLNEGQKKYKALTATYFKLYPRLYFMIIKKTDQITFAANRDPEYNGLLGGIINSLKAGKTIKNNFKIKNHNFYFNSSKIHEYDIITSFKYSNNFFFQYIRNFIITALLIGLWLAWKLKKGRKKYIKSYSTDNDNNDDMVFNFENESYRNLYKDNQKLIEQLENLSTFREVGLAINSILNFNQMLHAIMGVVTSKMGIQKIIIYFIDEENKELSAKIGREGKRIISEDELIEDTIILGSGALGNAMEYHTPIILSESSEGNMLVSPLVAQGNLIGSIKVANKLDTDIFTEEDKSLLSLLSSQIAIALNNARLYELAITDGLTQLYVHRHFQFRLQDELQRHKRCGKPLSLIMVDIDHFKNFNDDYGHQTGDYVLTNMAKILKSMFRGTDSAYRYGGEEMSIILPETESEDAYILAEKLRKEIDNHKFHFKDNDLNVTISLGVSTCYPLKTPTLIKEKLIKMADEAMYYSKENGRNRTTQYKIAHEEKQTAKDNINEQEDQPSSPQSSESIM